MSASDTGDDGQLSGPGLPVLIIDDDRELARAISMRLIHAGFNPVVAYDGAEGLAIAQRDLPAAILTDLRMPRMDGFEVLDRLQSSVHTASIPTIVLSSDAAETRSKVLRKGATYFLEKPYDSKVLIRALTVALRSTPDAEPANRPRERTMPTLSEINLEPNRRILIADDDPAVVRALSVRCKRLGLEVDTAENGLQAILKAQRKPPRLLILDINMPEADGFRVCEWLLDPQRPPVDVVMLTGRDDSETLVRCDSFGAFYVPKDRDTWETIRSIVAELLELDSSALEAADLQLKSNIAEEELSRQKRNKILIVDDDADFTRGLARRLSKCGAETITATNGVEAYRLALRERPSAIIADYVMPEGGGHYLLWRLKSTEETKHIPVIMITGQRFQPGTESPMERETTGREGAVALLHKPLDTDTLFKELSRHCAIQYAPR